MKRTALVVFALLVFVSTVFSHPPVVNTNPDVIVTQFYSWYIGRLVKDDFNPLKNRSVSLKYLTPQFLRRVPRLIKETDADPIICAQDFDPAWVKNLKVDAPTINGARATAHLQLDGRDPNRVKLTITLKQTAAGWRIDAVDCGY